MSSVSFNRSSASEKFTTLSPGGTTSTTQRIPLLITHKLIYHVDQRGDYNDPLIPSDDVMKWQNDTDEM